MSGMFVPAAEVTRQRLDWGWLGWCIRPGNTGSENLVVIEVTLAPGGSHSFHQHPQQDEVIYAITGQVEQWREQEHRTLGPGDSVFLPAGTVHATFNTGEGDAKLLAVLSPSTGDGDGYELVDVADQPPWNGLR